MAFKMKGFSGFQNKPTPNKFTGVPGGADVSWRADKHTWEFPEDTEEGQLERKEYAEFLNKRSPALVPLKPCNPRILVLPANTVPVPVPVTPAETFPADAPLVVIEATVLK